MIASFGDDGTADLFHGRTSSHTRRIPGNIVNGAARKLDLINAAHSIEDLRAPPGNRLEALKGNLKGYHSIRINQQWRIVFQWKDGAAHEVRINDYH
jgi:proteic killer suppression protein